MYMIKTFLWCIRALLSVILISTDVYGLKNVTLTLVPAIVQRSHNCSLICTYDLEGVPLYTVKWYRGFNEFYRYTPYDTPATKVFPTSGIKVAETKSNSTQVVLQDVEFNLSGKFMCEVTTEKGFSTGHDIKVLQVVQLPGNSPVINVNESPFGYGDVLIANCMSSTSKPPATLKFLLNNKTVARTDPLFIINKFHDLSWSDLSLNVTLTEEFFTGGKLILRCEAQIADVYHDFAEIKLNTADPVPERVRAFNFGSIQGSVATQLLLLMQFILLNR